MGNCIQKPKKGGIETNNILPINPSEDPLGNYLWINIHTNNDDFLKKQEEGFVICMTTNTNIGHKWLRKINTTGFLSGTPLEKFNTTIYNDYADFPNNNPSVLSIIPGIIMDLPPDYGTTHLNNNNMNNITGE